MPMRALVDIAGGVSPAAWSLTPNSENSRSPEELIRCGGWLDQHVGLMLVVSLNRTKYYCISMKDYSVSKKILECIAVDRT